MRDPGGGAAWRHIWWVGDGFWVPRNIRGWRRGGGCAVFGPSAVNRIWGRGVVGCDREDAPHGSEAPRGGGGVRLPSAMRGA